MFFKTSLEAIQFNHYCRVISFFEEKLVIHFLYCEITIFFCFWTKAYYSCFKCHCNKILNQTKYFCQVLTAYKISNRSNRRLLRYCTFIFSLSYPLHLWRHITWKWGWKPTKWRRPSCSNSWLWDGISRETFGALRSVMAHFLYFSRSFIWV